MPAKTLNIRSIRSSLKNLDSILEQNGEMIIERRGKAIARLLPMAESNTLPSQRDFRAKLKKLSVGSEVYLREERDRG